MIEKTTLALEKVKSHRVYQTAIFFGAMVLTTMARADLDGGLNTAKSNLTKIKTWGITFASIGAIIYLLVKAVQAWQGRADWGEFVMSVVYVAIAGGSTTIAGWAFGLF